MNFSIIKDIYNSCISENMPVTDGHKKTAEKLFEFEESIKKYLPEKDRDKLMREYSALQGELNCEIESTSFTEGFKTGLLIGFEVFSGLLKE